MKKKTQRRARARSTKLIVELSARDRARFVTTEGESVFEVRAGQDGRSIQVLCIDELAVLPRFANRVTVAKLPEGR